MSPTPIFIPAPAPIAGLSRPQLAAALNVSTKTLERLEKQGLPAARLGSLVRYDPEKVKEWLAEQSAKSRFQSNGLKKRGRPRNIDRGVTQLNH